jgi:hypothetical protein
MMRREVWDSMLDADMNARYWQCMSRRYGAWDTAGKVLMALTSSGAVAGWGFWAAAPAFWKTLSGTSAVVAILINVIAPHKIATRAASLAGQWIQHQIDYELLWSEIDSWSAAHTKRYNESRNREVTARREEATLPRSDRLVRLCQEAVKRSRRLSSSPKES